MNIPLSQPSLTHKERSMVAEAMLQGWISGTGPYIKDFERALTTKLGRSAGAVAVTNGTVALELVLTALGIGAGDEVIIPALTFVAPAAAVHRVGAKPVFVDIDESSWTIDPLVTADALTDKTKAVIGVDLLGHPADFAWLETALMLSSYGQHKQPIEIIEDAAQAHGARYCRIPDEPCGALAYISTMSFHANKAITTGEGGAVLTKSPEIADTVRLLANHGMTSQRPYWHEVVGTNNRMTNLSAAIGVAQVSRWDELTVARQAVAAAYDERLQGLFDSGVLQRRPVAEWAKESCWLYTVASPHRAAFIEALRAANIDARAIWYALPDLPPYRETGRGNHFPVARKVSYEAFWLPTWAGMPIETIDYICEVLDGVHEQLRAVPS